MLHQKLKDSQMGNFADEAAHKMLVSYVNHYNAQQPIENRRIRVAPNLLVFHKKGRQ